RAVRSGAGGGERGGRLGAELVGRDPCVLELRERGGAGLDVIPQQRPVFVEAAVLLDDERDLARPVRLGAEQGEPGEAEVTQRAVEVWRPDRHVAVVAVASVVSQRGSRARRLGSCARTYSVAPRPRSQRLGRKRWCHGQVPRTSGRIVPRTFHLQSQRLEAGGPSGTRWKIDSALAAGTPVRRSVGIALAARNDAFATAP